jgi:hypothetical protein
MATGEGGGKIKELKRCQTKFKIYKNSTIYKEAFVTFKQKQIDHRMITKASDIFLSNFHWIFGWRIKLYPELLKTVINRSCLFKTDPYFTHSFCVFVFLGKDLSINFLTQFLTIFDFFHLSENFLQNSWDQHYQIYAHSLLTFFKDTISLTIKNLYFNSIWCALKALEIGKK